MPRCPLLCLLQGQKQDEEGGDVWPGLVVAVLWWLLWVLLFSGVLLFLLFGMQPAGGASGVWGCPQVGN